MKKKILILSSIIYILLLITMNIYIRGKFDTFERDRTTMIISGQEDHDELIKNTKSITSYRRAISFLSGIDNDVIYKIEYEMNSAGEPETKNFDQNRYSWQKLELENSIIPAYRASTCNENLSKSEIILNTEARPLDSINLQKLLNQELTFKYNNDLIPLTVKKINDTNLHAYICISDELYDELIKDEKNHIYEIKMNSYKNYQKYLYKWINLETNDFYSISVPTSYMNLDESFKENRLSKFIDILSILNLVSVVLGIIASIILLIRHLTNKLNEKE